MPQTVTNLSGDGVNDVALRASIELPDSGGNVLIAGSVQAPGLGSFALTGSPLTAPGPPGSGTTYWNIQADTTSGACTVQQSSAADPAPISAANVVLFRQTLASTASANLALDGSTTPDQPV